MILNMDCLKNLIDSYYLDSQIRDDFQCTKACYTHDTTASTVDTNPQCTHTYDHISQQLNSLAAEQQQMLYTNKADALLFTIDTSTQCAFNITPPNLEIGSQEDVNETPHTTPVFISTVNINIEILLEMHIYSIMILIMVMYLFTKTNTQHYYNKSYKIPIGVYMIQSQPKAIRYALTWTLKLCLMPCIVLATQTVTKINHVPYQTIQYDDKGMFPAQLMDNTPIQVFIDNGATPSILPLSTYNKHPILQKYPKKRVLHPSTQVVQ